MFEIEAASRSERETLSLSGRLIAGPKTVRLAYTNDFDFYGEDTAKSVHLDRLEVRNTAGRVVVRLELEELPSPGDCASEYGDSFRMRCDASVEVPIEIPATGRYSIEVVVWQVQAGDELPRLSVVVEDAGGSGAGTDAIRSKLVELYDKLLGAKVTPHSPDVDSAYRLFVGELERRREVRQEDSNQLPGVYHDCRWGEDHRFFEGILDDVVRDYEHGDGVPYRDFDWERVEDFIYRADWSDPYQTAQAWVVVLAYLLMDYRYLYL